MENYFNYFTEIEEHFQKRRGQARPLSPLDWSLMESLREAGVPLAVVLRGVDQAFDKRSKRRRTVGHVNSLSYCTQTILAEYERHKESRIGEGNRPNQDGADEDLDQQHLIDLLETACRELEVLLEGSAVARLPALKKVVADVISSLGKIVLEVRESKSLDYEVLELKLNTFEERIIGAILSGISEESLLEVQKEIKREIGQHKRGLKSEHIAMLERKMMRKKLLESFHIPRLSLFYLPLN